MATYHSTSGHFDPKPLETLEHHLRTAPGNTELLHAYFREAVSTSQTEQARAVLIAGRLPDWFGLSIYLLVALIMAWMGFAWFQKTRKGFADVL